MLTNYLSAPSDTEDSDTHLPSQKFEMHTSIRADEKSPVWGLFYLRHEQKRSFCRDSKRLNISHGAKRVRYETCTVHVTKEIPTRGALKTLEYTLVFFYTSSPVSSSIASSMRAISLSSILPFRISHNKSIISASR